MSITVLFRVQFKKFYDRVAILLVVAKPLVRVIVPLHLPPAGVVHVGLFRLVVRPLESSTYLLAARHPRVVHHPVSFSMLCR